MLPAAIRTIAFANVANLLPLSWDPVPRRAGSRLLVLGLILLLALLTAGAMRLNRRLRRSQTDLINEFARTRARTGATAASRGAQSGILAALPDFLFVVSREGVLTDYYAPVRDLLHPPPEQC